MGLIGLSVEFFEYYNPVRIIHGINTLKHAGEYIAKYVGGNLALILLDTKTFLGCKNKLNDLVGSFKKNGLEYLIYDKTPLNPRLSDLKEVVDIYQKSLADIIIGFGDWNVINSAKVLAASISLGGRIDKILNNYHRVKASIPIVAIPSSHGSGLEFSGRVLLANDDEVRFAYSQALYPKLSILDPDVTLKTPLHIAVLSVVYALANALSALVSVESNPLSNLYASASIETILSNHKLLLEKPDNLVVRSRLLQASMFAGKAFDITGPSLIHIITHTVTFIYSEVYPGRVMAALLPSWLKHVLPRAGNKELIARVLGVDISKATSRLEEILDEIKAFIRLSDIGFERNSIPDVLRLVDENLRVDVKKILEDSL